MVNEERIFLNLTVEYELSFRCVALLCFLSISGQNDEVSNLGDEAANWKKQEMSSNTKASSSGHKTKT
jgi:hypothetical protein